MRIIAGQLRGRHLVAPSGEATRPTADRVREALFSIVGGLEGACVADVYAGTGALGLEALSRGARAAVFVENAPRALASLRKNIEALGVGARAVVIPRAVSVSALAGRGPFDIVFADPPYALVRSGAASETLGTLLDGGLVGAGGLLALEHDVADEPPLLTGASLTSTRRYGDTSLSFYECIAPHAAPTSSDDRTNFSAP